MLPLSSVITTVVGRGLVSNRYQSFEIGAARMRSSIHQVRSDGQIAVIGSSKGFGLRCSSFHLRQTQSRHQSHQDIYMVSGVASGMGRNVLPVTDTLDEFNNDSLLGATEADMQSMACTTWCFDEDIQSTNTACPGLHS